MADAVVAPENHNFGIQDLWDSGPVSKVLLSILVFMSLYSWYVLIVKALDQNALNKYAASVDKDFWSAPTIADGIKRMKGDEENIFRAIAADGLDSLEHHEKNKGKLTESIDLHDWVSSHMQRRVDLIQGDLSNGMAVLASVGATAPFVGLFGTVWGIYHALIAIGISGQASIDKVAGPVGEALIMTAIGLVVAVPAVLGFNWLTRRNKFIIERVNYFAHDLHQALLSGGRVAVGAKLGAAPPIAPVKK
jgi:biopolymer transport protein ExbB